MSCLRDGPKLPLSFSNAARTRREETRGIARLGKRVARYIRFNRTRLAHLFDGMEGRSWSVLSTILYLLQVNEAELPGFTRSRVPLHGIRQFEFNETVQKGIEVCLSRMGTRPPSDGIQTSRSVCVRRF